MADIVTTSPDLQTKLVRSANARQHTHRHTHWWSSGKINSMPWSFSGAARLCNCVHKSSIVQSMQLAPAPTSSFWSSPTWVWSVVSSVKWFVRLCLCTCSVVERKPITVRRTDIRASRKCAKSYLSPPRPPHYFTTYVLQRVSCITLPLSCSWYRRRINQFTLNIGRSWLSDDKFVCCSVCCNTCLCFSVAAYKHWHQLSQRNRTTLCITWMFYHYWWINMIINSV